jgi:hypothetical protein
MDSFPQITIKHNIGNTINIPNQIDVKAFSYIGNNLAVGVTAVPVDNASDFTPTGSILLLLSSMGTENAEIVVSTAHTNILFTTGATLFLHNRGDLVQELKWDQIVISKCSTINGTYAVLSIVTLNVTAQNTVIFDTAGLSTDYYEIQWKSSISGLLSDFSDPVSVLSYPSGSVASVIYPVLKGMGVNENDPRINVEFCLSAIDDARKYVAAKLYGIRQDWLEDFEFPIKVLAGNNFVLLPLDIDFNKTDRSLLAARFLIGNILTPFNLRYIDKRTWNQVAFQVTGSETVGNISIGATSIQLENTGDFWSSAGGVAFVATTDFSQTIMKVGYTGRDLTTNQLTGVTGITRAIPAGTRVWSNPTVSQPIYYTVFDDKLVFDRIVPDSMQGNNIYIDYYKELPEVNDLYQILEENYREIYKWYLKWAIKYRKDINLPTSDPDLVKFEGLVTALFNNLYSGQDTIIITS